jgi:hypothetical protein
MSDLFDAAQVADLRRAIDGWLSSMAAENPAIEAVDHGEGDEVRWYVRMAGEAKAHITAWLTLGQRTLAYEVYVMPAPLDNVARVYETALRHNQRLVGAHFAIGVEDAIFLRGEVPLVALDAEELDRIIGSLYAYVEHTFPSLLRLGFASRFT